MAKRFSPHTVCRDSLIDVFRYILSPGGLTVLSGSFLTVLSVLGSR